VGIDDQKKEKVAIKIISKNELIKRSRSDGEADKMSSNRQIDRLKMEIKNMRKMNHPNILKLIDVIDSPDNLYIILEYCASGEYFDFISK
jgi:5'-AMP-activated protein kinase catalytic alpha subunit